MGTLLFGQLYRSQCVSRFAALADSNHHIVFLYHRVAVAELAGIFHLHANAAHLLNELLADEAGVPRRAANHDDDMAGADEFGLEVMQGREVNVIRAVGELHHPAAHTVLDTLRLLENLFQHEVGIAALAQCADVQVDILHTHLSIQANLNTAHLA